MVHRFNSKNERYKKDWYIDLFIAKRVWKSSLTVRTYISLRLAISVILNILVTI
jgi:hypothetical protein